MKTGLVLEGGGMRGIYTAGVLDVFLENQIRVDGVMGVSAGAIHGCSFISEQKGRSIRYYKKYCNDKRFMSFRNFFLTGDIVGEKFCYEEIPKKLDPYDYEKFLESKTEFYVGCSNIETGKPEYIKITDMEKQMAAMRASASLPYFSKIINYEGMRLLDGGCTDSVPVEAFIDLGFEKNIVVLTRDINYIKKPEMKQMAKIFFRKYPAFKEALLNRHNNYNEAAKRIRKLEEDGKILVIRPSEELTIGRMESNPDKLQEVYDIGVRNAKENLEKVRGFLEK